MRFFYLVLLVFIISCTNQVEIIPIRTIEIPYSSNANRDFNFCEINGKQFYFYINKSNEKCLYLRNLELNKLEIKIPLNNILDSYPALKNDLTSECFYFNSLNEIIVLVSDDNVMLKIDNKGTILKTYHVKNNPYPGNLPFVFQAFSNSKLSKINNNEFICRVIPNIYAGNRKGRLAFFNLSPICKLKIIDDSLFIESTKARFPYIVSSTGDNYGDYWMIFTINDKNEIIYSYSACDSLYVITNDGINNSIYVNSQFTNVSSRKVMDSIELKKDPYKYTLKYFTENYFNVGIIYNKQLNCYLRIVKLPISYLDNDGLINQNKNWSIIYLDESFQKLGETIFKNDSLYDYRDILPTKKGFLIGMQQTDLDKENEKYRLCEFEIKF